MGMSSPFHAIWISSCGLHRSCLDRFPSSSKAGTPHCPKDAFTSLLLVGSCPRLVLSVCVLPHFISHGRNVSLAPQVGHLLL